MTTWVMRICAIALSFVMFFSAWTGFVENRALAAHGREALVEPPSEYTETTTIRKKFFVTVGESKTRSAELYFTPEGGQRTQIHRNLPDAILEKFANGEDVYVRYLPSDPRTARFEGHSPSTLLSLLMGLVATALTVVFWRKM